MAKIEHAEALRRLGRLLDAGDRPGLVVMFRLDEAGAVCVDIGCGGGLADGPMVTAALEVALAGVATADLVAGPIPHRGGLIKGLTEHVGHGLTGPGVVAR